MEGTGYCPTGKHETLILSTDRSEYSEGAIREAISYAKKCGCKLYVMTVVEIMTEYEAMGDNLTQLEEKEAKTHLDAVKARAAAEGVDCETTVRYGDDPFNLIVEEATEKKADLIIMGRRGIKGIKKFLMGQTASRVIGYAPCDVLVVPRAAQIEYNHIMVATDGSSHGRAAVKRAVDIAKRCGGSIIAVSVARSDSEAKEAEKSLGEAAETAKYEAVPCETVKLKGKPFEAIVETAGGRGVDLIVMGTYGKTGLSRVLMGSTTEKVIGLVGCGVLVVK